MPGFPPPLDGDYAGDPDAYEVVITRSRSLLLSALFLTEDMEIRVRAVSRSTQRSAYCVLALASNAANAINFSGGPTVKLNGCGVNANSIADDALNLTGNAYLEASWAQVRGEIDQSGKTTLKTEDAPEEHSFLRTDPFAGLHAPAQPANCPSGNPSTYSPCTFSGGISWNSHANVTLQPGTYFVDGAMSISGGAKITGTGVTLYFTDGGSIRVNGGAEMNITAPSSGTYAGMAMVQSRSAPAGVTNKFNGGSTMNIQGAIYFPKQDVEFTGGNALGGGCTRIVSNTVTFTGNAVMGNNCSGLGLPTTLDDEPQLVE